MRELTVSQQESIAGGWNQQSWFELGSTLGTAGEVCSDLCPPLALGFDVAGLASDIFGFLNL